MNNSKKLLTKVLLCGNCLIPKAEVKARFGEKPRTKGTGSAGRPRSFAAGGEA